MHVLTQDQAYAAMFDFLEAHWRRTGSGDVAALLGSLSLLPDGRPVDAALRDDWNLAVQRALSGEVESAMKLESQ